MTISFVEIITICIYGLTLVSIIAVFFFEHKDPASTLTWILILSYLPVAGLILYIFLGRGLKLLTIRKLHIRREMQEKYHDFPPPISRLVSRMKEIKDGEPFAFQDPRMERHRGLITQNFILDDAVYSQDNDLVIYTGAEEHYRAMFEEIRHAKKSVQAMYFIIANDEAGRAFVGLLAEKAGEGVQVQLIYDELGSIATPRHMFWRLGRAGGKVYRFFPMRLGTLLRANYRNHHKIVVIDGKIAYTGGMNIGDNYLGLHRRIRPWRDTHMRITGTAASALQMQFLMDLFYATENEKLLAESLASFEMPGGGNGNIGMQVVSSGPDSPGEAVKRGLIRMIASAKRSVYIQSPYLMPDEPVLQALQNAAAGGVEVVVMLPGIPDKRAVYTVTCSYIKSLLDYGVKVYLHRGFLHAKMLVADDEIATIGTTNLDMRSFSLHFEVNVFLYDTATARQCGEIFLRDLADCTLLTQEAHGKRPVWRKALEKILRIFAPLM